MPRARKKLRILFASSEAHPLAKTGGLGDVSAALPAALCQLGQDVRIVLPAYREVLARAQATKTIATLPLPRGQVKLLETRLPGTDVLVYLVSHPPSFDRPGTPYAGPEGEWPDNARRFALFNDVITALALDQAGLGWRPDLLHGNDWQTSLCFAQLSQCSNRPASIFSIHNLAYQGCFPGASFQHLDLPRHLWQPDALEFHTQLNFMKGGLVFADRLITVSPTYAREIQTAEHGHGLDGLLRHRSAALTGILNGIDTIEWNPATDPHLDQTYTSKTLALKSRNKLALQHEMGLPVNSQIPLFGLVGRLVEQKGIDLILSNLPDVLNAGAQLVVLGSGDARYQQALQDWARSNPAHIAIRIAHDERLAHRIEAGADLFLMPSRYEPCGLNQMYSQRYGTLPIVRRTGGLADTVVHADASSLTNGTATGIVFEHADAQGLRWAISEALRLYTQPQAWQQTQLAGMARDDSWQRAARDYLSLYRDTLGILDKRQ